MEALDAWQLWNQGELAVTFMGLTVCIADAQPVIAEICIWLLVSLRIHSFPVAA